MTQEEAQAKAKKYMDWLGENRGSQGRLSNAQLDKAKELYDEAVNAVSEVAPGLRGIVDRFDARFPAPSGVKDAVAIFLILEAAAEGRWG